ncbi:MAG TPA: presqualene diphosphate synthase HpnD [Verrucomicrobiota bacterium]|nr:presqualene diphosphate synthase HpnD [Verrucomicrobiota bacterium]HNU50769.1 presqualene diphosphate synthase HpnD [Verrucomicrobiota bacterium]
MSYAVSQSITRKSASNLALAFILLRPEKRKAMSALYAFCRQVDDLADEETTPQSRRRQQLEDWRRGLAVAFSEARPEHPVLQELQPVIARYHLPHVHFEDLLEGVAMDLEITDYPDATQLELYCYRVASVVGLLSIEIFGYRNPQCRDYAVALGKALQLTNILRDVADDADRGRVYLPADERRRFGVSRDDLLRHRYTPAYRALAEAVAGRARHFYAQARNLLPVEDQPAMQAAELMGAVYWRLLERLEARHFNVFAPGTLRVGKATKLRLILRTWWRCRTRSRLPNYGPA